MVEVYPVIDLESGWARGEREPGGDEEKRWFEAPPGNQLEGRWLFKPHREKELLLSKERKERGEQPEVLVRGEDWAEKIATELAHLIALPAAEAQLASVIRLRDGRRVRGTISRDIRPEGWSLSAGASLLAERDEEFDADSSRGHNLHAIRAALERVRGPAGTSYEHWSGFEVFAGYLLFDAWVANTDRHAYNWAVLQGPAGLFLGHSFDHGSALGSGAGEASHHRVLQDVGIEQWCARGFATRFPDGGRRTLVELADEALTLAGERARHHWTRQIARVDQRICHNVLDAIPDLSEVTRTFVAAVLTTNQRRLIDVQ